MEHFKKEEFVIIDVETTGLSPQSGDRIIEIAALKIKDLRPVDQFATFVDPQRPLSYGAFMVNKITAEMIDGAPAARDILPALTDFIGDAYLIGHNIKFDFKFIQNEYDLCGQQMPLKEHAFDTIKMARKILPELRTYSLRNVATYLDIRIDYLHRAMADVDLTYKVFDDLLHRSFKQDITDMQALIKHFGVSLKLKEHR